MTTFDGSTEPDRRAAREVEAVLCSKLSEAEFFYLLAQGHLDDVTLTGRAGAEEAAAVLRERRLRKNERNTASVAKQDRAASLQRFERAVSAARWAWARHSREVIQFRRDHLGDGPIPVEEIETWRSANPRAAHEADRVAADLEDLHFWESGDGVAFLLADSLPMVNVISIDADYLSDPDPRRRPRFTMSIDADVTPEELADAYAWHRAQAREDLGVKRFARRSDKTLVAAAFALRYVGFSWQERFQRFRDEYPEYASGYADWRAFRQSIGRFQTQVAEKTTPASFDAVFDAIEALDPDPSAS